MDLSSLPLFRKAPPRPAVCAARPAFRRRNPRPLPRVSAFALAALFALALPGQIHGRSVFLDLRGADASATRSARTGDAPLSAPKRDRAASEALRETTLAPGAADVGAVETGDELELALFDDAVLSLALRERTPSAFGDTFLAEVSGCEGVRNAVVLRTEEGLTVDVQDVREGRIYKVLSTPAGVTVQEIRPSGEGACGCDALEPVQPAAGADGGTSVASANQAALRSGAQSDSCVDVLVAFDRNAASWVDSYGGGLTNFAQVAVQKMNAALSNTGLSSSFRFRLVGVTSLSVSATDVHKALYALRDGEAGWKDVATVRDQVGADIVTTMIDTGSASGTTGVGWSLSSESSLSSFGPSAYNVCAVRSVAQSHTMTHECGHNLGAGHSTLQDTQPGPQLYSYSAGHYFKGSDGKAYCTIMAYAGEGPGGSQIPFFSSPDHVWMETPTGDASHDNTRTIASTWSYAANWRERKTPMSYDVEFSPASGTLFDGTLSVTLATAKSGAQIRYTLDGSAPTPSSPLYSGPIRLTATTTIKAATCDGGVCSLPFEASYYAKDDLGYALGLPELPWTSSGGWRAQTTNTVDGVGLETPGNATDATATLSTRVAGPATLCFHYRQNGYYNFAVLCDGASAWKSSEWRSSWREASIDVPAGEHEIVFRVKTISGYSGYFFGLDALRLYRVRAPKLSPATSANSATAAEFTDETMVSLTAEDGDAVIYYTLDGSDPDDEGAILYDGPFFLSESTRVRAVATRPGFGTSAETEGVYVERHKPKAGEWTFYGDGAVESVQEDGRMVAFLYCRDDCGYCNLHRPCFTSPVFLDWAEANGVYLVELDSYGEKPGTEAYSRHFGPLIAQFPGMGGGTPTYVFASGADPSVALGAMGGIKNTSGKTFDYTVDSLIECFASYLDDAAPLGAPVASVADANGRTFPFSVTLSNPNGTGTIYYTLDGSAPTRTSGIRYTGAISIPRSGTTLKAIVWPNGSTAVSGIPLSVTYESLTETLDVPGVSWANDSTRPWTLVQSSSGILLRGGKDTSLTSGTADSTLTASVTGPGVLSFHYNFYPWQSKIVLRKNGVNAITWPSGSRMRGETNVVVTTGGTTTFQWVYTYSYRENSYTYLNCDVSDVVWTPHVPPAAVQGLAAQSGTYADGVVLRWTPADNADAYVAYRGTTSNASSATRLGTTDKDRYWDFAGEVGRTYYYWVAASNAWGEGPLSSPVRATCSASRRTVALDRRGGSGGTESVTATYGAAMPAVAVPARAGYVFGGYWSEPDGGGIQYYSSSGSNLRTWSRPQDTTLYAKWTFHDPDRHDDFADARVLSGASGSWLFLNEDYGLEDGDPFPYSGNYASAWAVWTAPETGRWRFSAADATGDGVRRYVYLYVYAGNALDALTRTASATGYADDAVGTTFQVEKGTTYRIAMTTSGGSAGVLSLNWEGGAESLAFSQSSQFVFRSGGVFSAGISSTVPWSFRASPGWVSPLASSGAANEPFSFRAEENGTGAVRSGTIMVGGSGAAPAPTTVYQGTLDWATNRTEALQAAWRSNRRVLLVRGGASSYYTRQALFSAAEDAGVKAALEAGYVLWYNDTATAAPEGAPYVVGLANNNDPVVAIIDPAHSSVPAANTNGYTIANATALSAFLAGNATWGGLPWAMAELRESSGDEATFAAMARAWGAGGSSATVDLEAGADAAFSSVVSTRRLGVLSSLGAEQTWTVGPPSAAEAGFYRIRVTSGTQSVVSDVVALVPFAAALDCDNLTFETGGNAPWTGIVTDSHDGADAARSGGIGDSQSSWLQTTVDGPGTISFWWNVSSESVSWDHLEFAIDGTRQARIGGTNETWTSKTFSLAEGSHVLRWTYSKDGSYSNGRDCGWVDQISWAPVPRYTVTYCPGASGTGDLQTATKVKDVSLALEGAIFTRTGYVQTGWATSDGGSRRYNLSAIYTANAETILYPFWTANKYTVTLNRQSGSGGSASVTATYGSAMPSITVPRRTGYAFGGYFTDVDGGGTQYYAADGSSARAWATAAATTLYAKWTAETYAVTLDRQGGAGGDDSATATYGSAMPAIVPPTRPGHTFGGYYTAANGAGTQYYTSAGESARTWNRTSAATLYAKWTANTYVVALDSHGGTDGTASVTATFGAAMPAIRAPVRIGHAFGGYYSDEDGRGTQYYDASGASARAWDGDAVATLHAKWTVNTYEIPLDARGGAGGAESVAATYGEAFPAVAVPTRTGYSFAGYYAEENGAATQYYDETGTPVRVCDFAAAATLFARWIPNVYVVDLDLQGGFGGTESVEATYDSPMPAITLPTLEGRVFVGYFAAPNGGGAQYYSDVGESVCPWNVAAPTTLFAHWATPKYAVVFNANGGTLPKGKKMARQSMSYGKSAKLRKNVFTRKGYVFAGWAVRKGGAVAFADAASVKNLRTDGGTATLYAVWAKPTYKVQFVANGGKGKMAVQSFKYGKAAKLKANAFTRKGYVFQGWAKSKADAKNGKVAYKNKKAVKNLVTTGKTVKLYAVWKKN